MGLHRYATEEEICRDLGYFRKGDKVVLLHHKRIKGDHRGKNWGLANAGTILTVQDCRLTWIGRMLLQNHVLSDNIAESRHNVLRQCFYYIVKDNQYQMTFECTAGELRLYHAHKRKGE